MFQLQVAVSEALKGGELQCWRAHPRALLVDQPNYALFSVVAQAPKGNANVDRSASGQHAFAQACAVY